MQHRSTVGCRVEIYQYLFFGLFVIKSYKHYGVRSCACDQLVIHHAMKTRGE
jgi:hypothetical protein